MSEQEIFLTELANDIEREVDAILNEDKVMIGFKRLSDDAILPTKAHPTDSGFDLYASKDVIIEPGETKIIPTGIAVELPPGYEATVRPRSGITAKTKLRVQLGTIDNEYRGEIGVIVDNIAPEDLDGMPCEYFVLSIENKPLPEYKSNFVEGTYIIRKGDRIAQLVIQPLPAVEAYEIEDELEETERGEGGFGSSGVRDTDQDNDFLEAFQDYQGVSCSHGPEPEYCPYCTEYDDNLLGWRPKREDD